MRARFVSVPALVLLAAASMAQVRETVNVNVVEVPVTVVDRDGNPVRGLSQANFELYDDGKKREIQSIDRIDFTSPESMRSVSPLNPAARRNFMLLFDMSFASPKGLARAQEAARNFLKNVERRDLVSVGTIDADRGFRVITAFTTDRALVDAAITNPGNYVAHDPLQIASVTTFDLKEQNLEGGRGGAAADHIIAIANGVQKQTDAYTRQKVEKQFAGLGELAKTLRAVSGRKQIVFLSEGFDPKVISGRDARSSEGTLTDSEHVVQGQTWKVDNDARFGNTTTLREIDEMARYFRGSDVVLNAIDVQGVRVDIQDVRSNAQQTGNKITSNEGLFLLARPTGGEVFANANDIGSDLTRMLHQQEVVYVLAFPAPTSKPGRFHDLKVKLVNVPGAHAFARAGYYEAGAETAAERTLSNAEIILNDIAQNDVKVAALSAAFPTSGANAQVPVILEIDGNDLARTAKGNTAAAEIFIYAFDDEGIVRDRLYQKLSLDLGKVGAKLRASGVKYYGTLSLPPGTYAVKTLVRVPEVEKRGYARTDVVVPKPGQVAMQTPMFFEEGGNWLMVKGNSHDATNAPYPFEIGGQQFIPEAAARVKNGAENRFAVIVYGAAPDELSLDTTPSTKLIGKVPAGSATKVVLQLDAATAPKLDVRITKRGGDTQTVSVPLVAQ